MSQGGFTGADISFNGYEIVLQVSSWFKFTSLQFVVYSYRLLFTSPYSHNIFCSLF